MSLIPVHDVREFFDSAQTTLGNRATLEDGSEWIYVKFEDAVTYVSGHVCSWKDADAFVATNDESAGNDHVAGVIAYLPTGYAVPTENQYGYIQQTGRHPAVAKVAGTDTFAVGDGAIMHATSDGVADKASVEPPAVADLDRWLGKVATASEDGASGTYPEDTVGLFLNIQRASRGASANLA